MLCCFVSNILDSELNKLNRLAKIFEENGYIFCVHAKYGNCFKKKFQNKLFASNVYILNAMIDRKINVRIERNPIVIDNSGKAINDLVDGYVITLEENTPSIIESTVFFIDSLILGLIEKTRTVYSFGTRFFNTVLLYKESVFTMIETSYSKEEEVQYVLSHLNLDLVSKKIITVDDLENKDLIELVNEVKEFCKVS